VWGRCWGDGTQGIWGRHGVNVSSAFPGVHFTRGPQDGSVENPKVPLHTCRLYRLTCGSSIAPILAIVHVCGLAKGLCPLEQRKGSLRILKKLFSTGKTQCFYFVPPLPQHMQSSQAVLNDGRAQIFKRY
jgi:hypothetical protein